MYPWIRKWDFAVRGGGISRRLVKRTIGQLAKGQVTRANCRISKERSLVEHARRRFQRARGMDAYGRSVVC